MNTNMNIKFNTTDRVALTAIKLMILSLLGENIAETVTVGNVSITTTETETDSDAGKPIAGDPNTNKDLDPPTITADGVELDKDGLPWDARINAKTKTKNADDTWKTLRRPKKDFVDDESWQAFIASVKAELVGDEVPPANDFGKTETEAEPEMSFPVLMKMVTGSGGLITTEMLQEVCDSYEIDKPSDLGKLDNKILLPAIYEELQAMVSE